MIDAISNSKQILTRYDVHVSSVAPQKIVYHCFCKFGTGLKAVDLGVSLTLMANKGTP